MEKQKKARSRVKVTNQGSYVDSNRNMAVVMGDKELSKALKHFDRLLWWLWLLVVVGLGDVFGVAVHCGLRYTKKLTGSDFISNIKIAYLGYF